jgi:hypothetical protein
MHKLMGDYVNSLTLRPNEDAGSPSDHMGARILIETELREEICLTPENKNWARLRGTEQIRYPLAGRSDKFRMLVKVLPRGHGINKRASNNSRTGVGIHGDPT